MAKILTLEIYAFWMVIFKTLDLVVNLFVGLKDTENGWIVEDKLF